jgi:AMP-polyphosphate phosphotransferase
MTAIKKDLKALQLKMLRIQQGIWHRKDRVIIVMEGFDAAGKGGAIRRLTEKLDPRSYRVHPIGPPDPTEQAKHYLYRFWQKLPEPGTIAIFDRSWYGRVLVERVDGLTPELRLQQAYNEINEFERALQDDGIVVIKFFLDVSKDEQLKRFQARLNDPYKQWKLTLADLKARQRWDEYAEALQDIFKLTNPKSCPWHRIDADNKQLARSKVLTIVTRRLKFWEEWLEAQAQRTGKRKLERILKEMGSSEALPKPKKLSKT